MTSDPDYAPNDGQPEEQTTPEAAEASAGKIAALEDEVAALNDRILRLAAELENTRRRADREKQDASRYAIASFARDLVNVADIFDRALQTLPPEGAEASPEALSSFAAGVRMTERSLVAANAMASRRSTPRARSSTPTCIRRSRRRPPPASPPAMSRKRRKQASSSATACCAPRWSSSRPASPRRRAARMSTRRPEDASVQQG